MNVTEIPVLRTIVPMSWNEVQLPLIMDGPRGEAYTQLAFLMTAVCGLYLVWLLADWYIRNFVYDGWIGFLLKFRWIAVLLVVLPLSRIMGMYDTLREWYFDNFLSAPEEHDKRVKDIQARVKRWIEKGRPGGRLCTARPQWQRVQMRVGTYQTKENAIPMNLYDILKIDTQCERPYVRVEPGVNMGKLTKALLKHGYTLPVTPELEELTVGGLVNGYGLESSSHKYGLFADTAQAYEILVANGEVIRASPEQNKDLYYAIPWSYGAHGFLMAVELDIIPCKPYVRQQYVPVNSRDEAVELYSKHLNAKNPYEFVELILYGPEHGVLFLGDYAPASEAESPENKNRINQVDKWYKKWYYAHARDVVKEKNATVKDPVIEYIPTREFYHRHTKSIFWEGELILPFGNHPLFRYTLGWMMPLNVGLLKLTQGETLKEYYYTRHVCQDALVHIDQLKTGIEFFHKNFECYPLWSVGHRTYKTEPQGMMQPLEKDRKLKPGEYEMWVDIGAWYVPGPVWRHEPYDGTERRKAFEDWCIKQKGYQCLYAVTEMTRNQWRTMFNMDIYDHAREKYQSKDVFMDTYDKVSRR